MNEALLCLFAFLAGFVDAVAGGGGLIQLPALLLFLPGAEANLAGALGVNKFASICGTTVAVAQYARRVPIKWEVVGSAAAVAFAGSFLGARAVSGMRTEVLKPVVLALLVVVALHTFLRKSFGDLHAPKLGRRRELAAGLATGLPLGFYDGFFGPGTGSFLIFIFIGVFGYDFLSASAGAKVVNFATNLAAVLYFGLTGNIQYEIAAPMALCNILGAMAGARLAMLRGNQFVRRLFLGVVCLMIARFGWEVAGLGR